MDEQFTVPGGWEFQTPPAGLVGVVLCVTFAKNPQPMLAWAKSWTGALPVGGLPGWLRVPFMGGGRSADGSADEVELGTAAVDEDVLRHRIAAVPAVDETVALSRIRLPVLVVRASDDWVVPRAGSEHLLAGLPSGELVTVEGPHGLLQSRPSECAAAVMRFLDSL